jgi:tRNA(fMet)-specific endonuclease VapC
MRWMLDTDVCIALIKQRHDRLLRKLHSKSIGQVGLSSITLSELSYGVAKSSRPQENQVALDAFLLPFDVAPFDSAAAAESGAVRAQLQSTGKPIGPLDTLIAGHAKSLDVILVTHNTQEFSRVPHLRLEDWLAS